MVVGDQYGFRAAHFNESGSLGLDRRSFGNHAGGTSQVKRMVVATRVLGLPR